MARIRSIKPDFFTSEQVAECSPSARLLFVGMWCFCDDNGVHPASPARLKMEVFPGDDFTKADIAAMVQELVKHGLVDEYEVDGDRFWRVTGWKHQKIDKPSYKYPLPLSENSSNARREGGDSSPPEGKGEEGSREEGKEKKNPPNPPAGAEGEKPGRRKKAKITFPAFIDACREAGEKPICADDPIFTFATDAGIPRDFLHLAWREFANKHRTSGRMQKDWRAHFRDAVRRNWFKLWWFPSEGSCELTTAGVQLKRERDAAAKQAEQPEHAA